MCFRSRLRRNRPRPERAAIPFGSGRSGGDEVDEGGDDGDDDGFAFMVLFDSSAVRSEDGTVGRRLEPNAEESVHRRTPTKQPYALVSTTSVIATPNPKTNPVDSSQERSVMMTMMMMTMVANISTDRTSRGAIQRFMFYVPC